MDHIIRSNTIFVALGMLLACIQFIYSIQVSQLLIIYTGAVLAFLGLFVPISYQITFSAAYLDDPVYLLRENKWLDFVGFIVGMPGFFVLLLPVVIASMITDFGSLTFYYLLLFLSVYFFQSCCQIHADV